MPWYAPWTDLIKKKVCRYLLQRYLGQFLKVNLTLEQLSVDLYNGKGTVCDLDLSSQALNELCANQGWGIEVKNGSIGRIAVTVPWNALMSDDSNIEVSGFRLTVRPLARPSDGSSMFESMWSSMSSSRQLAQECIENDGDISVNAQIAAIEGLENFAQTIDSILNRVKAKLHDTEIRLEYLPQNGDHGIAIVIKIDRLYYENEAGSDPLDKHTELGDEKEDYSGEKTQLIATYASHHVKMEGITFYTEEFRLANPKPNMNMEQSMVAEQFYSTISQLPETDQIIASEKLTRTESDRSDSDTEDDLDDEPEIIRSEKIMFARVSGEQEFRIKMKQAESISGPKVILESSLGAFFLFLSPRQLHLLCAFSDAFLKNEKLTKTENKKKQQKQQEQKQRDIEIQRVYIQKRFNSMSGVVGLNQGFWSDVQDDNYGRKMSEDSTGLADYRDLIKPLGLGETAIPANNSMSSSMCSSSISTCTTNTAKTGRRGIESDPNADISQYNIRIACITIVLLHEEILVEYSSHRIPAQLSEQSISKLKQLSETFFTTTQNLSIGALSKDIQNANGILKSCCENNHLRLFLSPIIIEGEEQRNASGILLKLKVSMARADFREILQETTVPLIEFYREELYGGIPKRADVILNIKQTTPSARNQRSQRAIAARTEFNFCLSSCTKEIDISIFDRLHAVFGSSPFLKTCNNGADIPAATSNKNSEQKIEIKIEAPSVDIRIRFPIPDSRPLHDPGRVPWWKQNVRPDFLLLKFQQFRLKYLLPSLIEIAANELDINYYENLNSPKIHLGKSTLIDKGDSRFRKKDIEYPSISIEFPSEEVLRTIIRKISDENENGNGNYYESVSSGMLSQQKKEPSPFSSKRVCRESDTPHSKQQTDDPETLIIPGDLDEMRTFCDNAMKTSKVQINVNLPIASIQLSSKHMYETIYNRINTDLLMWESSAPRMSTPTQRILPSLADSLLNAGMMDSLYVPPKMCPSSSSDEDDAENECDSDNIYFSLCDRKRTKRPVQTAPPQAASACAFQLKIEQGILALYTPVRDAQNRVLPGQSGEFTAKVNSVCLFSVSKFCGNDNLAYLCMHGKSIELFHCGLISFPVPDFEPRYHNFTLPAYMQSTLYPTPKNLTLNEMKGSKNREMFSLALQIKAYSDQRLKRIRVAAGIQNTTLRHNPVVSQHIWLTQLIDMFDVLDYPIEGYIPYGVVTEMHLHLWDCSIDYRPLYLPFRAVATLGNFMISSNLTTASSGCTLRFVAEEGSLCLAPYEPCKGDKEKSAENVITALPSLDLVCVLDLGLFEISLRLNEKQTASFPKFDLRASINDVHIRTCSDSGHALAQLIAYLASDGDLNKKNEPNEADSSEMGSKTFSHKKDEDELLTVKQTVQVVPEVSPIQQERVNTLMAEAMQESLRTVPQTGEETGCPFDQGVEVFFFPDETLQSKKNKNNSKELADDSELSGSTSLTQDDDEKSMHDDGEVSLSESSTAEACSIGNRRASEDTDSLNTEMRDLLNFENSVMHTSYMPDDSVVEALPEVKKELGEVSMPTTSSKLIPGRDGPGTSNSGRKISNDTDDEYCFIAEEEKARCVHEEVEVSEEPIRIIDNHFSLPIGKPDLLKAPQSFPMAVMRYTLCEMTLTWHIYGGSDFPKSDESASSKDDEAEAHMVRFTHLPMSDAYKYGVSYSRGSPSVHFGNRKGSKLSWKNRGGRGRKHDVLMEVQISKVRFSHETYPTNTKQASRQVLLVTELEIRDRLKVSEINKFLYHPSVNQRPKKGSQHMIVIKALHIRPCLSLSAQECCLRVSMLPLRLNIDQDSLLFLVQFFSEFGGAGKDGSKDSSSTRSTPTHQPPVMMVDDIPEAVQDLHARKLVSENLMLLMEDEEKEKDVQEATCDMTEDTPIYFREIEFSPDVPIKLDYHGKRIELSRGPLAGLLMGLGQLHCSEIRLKKICHKHGILGVDRLLNFLFQEWLYDIKKNQLPSLFSGFGPMHTLVQLFQGIRDLFWLPIEQYQKDGRIVRGLQLGAQSFTARTALAALEITTRLIQLLQFTAETAYDMVSPGPSVRRRYNRKGKRKRIHPPQDIREGVVNAFQIVKEGIGDTAHTLVEVATVEHDQKGYTGAVGAVVRQIPPIVVRPLVLATQATTNVLGGVKNQLVPDARIEAREKWKDDDE